MANFQEQGLVKQKQGDKKQAAVVGTYQSLDLLDFIGSKGPQLSQADQAIAMEKKRLEGELQKTKQLQDDFSRLAGGFSKVVQELEEERKLWWQKFQKEVAEVALLIASRVVDMELKTNPQVVMRGIETLITALGEGETRNFLINPEDLEFLTREKPDAVEELKAKRHVSLISDASLPRGSVRLDRNHYQMEYSMLKALKALSDEVVPNPVLTGVAEKPKEPEPVPEAAPPGENKS